MADLNPVDAMTILSPAAAAVLDAFLNGYICSPECNVAYESDRNAIAAALRAAANIGDSYNYSSAEALDLIIAIAAELEGQ